ncbi:hypothetical protein, partial [Streptomyces sp. MZ04]|uniref:hypothetical protein n=1 Tax=Streptomyces sp. MZ04 TaxID=2559236 RepID=UPI001ADFBFC4
MAVLGTSVACAAHRADSEPRPATARPPTRNPHFPHERREAFARLNPAAVPSGALTQAAVGGSRGRGVAT